MTTKSISIYKPYLAINQFGEQVWINKHPRKELMEHCGSKHAQKMFVDIEGEPHHVGYVIGRQWWDVFRVGALHGTK
jgi:hypothetical protein